jgi:tryptophan synthase alpha chain
MSQRLNQMIKSRLAESKKLLSVFVTAGFPELADTKEILLSLDKAGADFVELGIPFSDPIADGPVIQAASNRALKNGIRVKDVLEIVREVRRESAIPILLMGYLNPVYRMGLETFCQNAHDAGADGLILPDWPVEESVPYQSLLRQNDLDLIHLIAPNTPPDRLDAIEAASSSFIYGVAYTGVTGQENPRRTETFRFFKSLKERISLPLMIGFGVKSARDYQTYCEFADGVIIGSAFLRLLETPEPHNRDTAIRNFIQGIVK